MPESSRPLRVFLCHSSNDKPVVRELYQRLREEDWIDPWLDENKLYPGQDWNFEIEKAVEEADIILVCLTKNSVNKEGYVQRELRIVLDLADYKPEGTLFVIPVRLEECDPPRRLRSWQYADYFPEGERDAAYQRMLVSLRMRAKRLGLSMISLPEEAERREDQEELARKKAEEKEARDRKALEDRAGKLAEEKIEREKEERKPKEPVRMQMTASSSSKEINGGEKQNIPAAISSPGKLIGNKVTPKRDPYFIAGAGVGIILLLICGVLGIN
jgi:hypothetical protein